MRNQASSPLRIGVDVGGTFTDFVVADSAGNELHHLKTPSVPAAPAQAVLNGLRVLAEERGVDPRAVTTFVHGTTLAVNTIIQRGGRRTGLLITEGFRDVLELARLRLSDPTNYAVQRVEPLVLRADVREVTERMTAAGKPYRRLDVAQLASAAEELVRSGVEALAVCFLHAYRNPAHERAAAAALRDQYPELYISVSSEIWPQMAEYERALITVMNSYVGERMSTYFVQLQHDVSMLGVNATVFSTKSNGGVMTARTAGGKPVETLMSGPASGVMGARFVAQRAGYKSVVTLDIGGTSADVSIIEDDVSYSTESQVGDFPVIMPAIEIASIGAGGGSIGWADSSGVLKVGPRSAGADPGPACYGRGAMEPTVTDAYLALGFVRPDHFLGGDLPLDVNAATGALARVGASLGLDPIAVAAGIIDVATANMYAQFMPLMARKGVDPEDFVLIAFGGAGPTHALFLAREVGIGAVVVPPSPGTLCALGCLVMDLKSDFIRSVVRRLDTYTSPELERVFKEIEAEARRWLDRENVPNPQAVIQRSADMRYRGQSFDINVALPGSGLDPRPGANIRRAYDAAYRKAYGFHDPAALVEIVNLRVTIVGKARRTPRRSPSSPTRARRAVASGSTRVYVDGKWTQADIYERARLSPGATFAGPAVVEQYDTTVLVLPGFTARVDDWLNVVIRRRKAPNEG
jgi:N-methylhydantoinase A